MVGGPEGDGAVEDRHGHLLLQQGSLVPVVEAGEWPLVAWHGLEVLHPACLREVRRLDRPDVWVILLVLLALGRGEPLLVAAPGLLALVVLN